MLVFLALGGVALLADRSLSLQADAKNATQVLQGWLHSSFACLLASLLAPLDDDHAILLQRSNLFCSCQSERGLTTLIQLRDAPPTPPPLVESSATGFVCTPALMRHN